MKQKLTLSIDKTIKERAKKLAKSRGVSISKIVEEYLDRKTSGQHPSIPDDSPVHQFSGSLPLPQSSSIDSYKDRLEKALKEKYDFNSA